jgi:hypothetical protein
MVAAMSPVLVDESRVGQAAEDEPWAAEGLDRAVGAADEGGIVAAAADPHGETVGIDIRSGFGRGASGACRRAARTAGSVTFGSAIMDAPCVVLWSDGDPATSIPRSVGPGPRLTVRSGVVHQPL